MNTKPSGMEMMIRSIFKAFGVDPDMIKAEIENRLAAFEASVKNMDTNLNAISTRLDTIDKTQSRIEWRIERIELHLGFIAGEIPLDLRDPALKPQPMELAANGETETEGKPRGSRSRGH